MTEIIQFPNIHKPNLILPLDCWLVSIYEYSYCTKRLLLQRSLLHSKSMGLHCVSLKRVKSHTKTPLTFVVRNSMVIRLALVVFSLNIYNFCLLWSYIWIVNSVKCLRSLTKNSCESSRTLVLRVQSVWVQEQYTSAGRATLLREVQNDNR